LAKFGLILSSLSAKKASRKIDDYTINMDAIKRINIIEYK